MPERSVHPQQHDFAGARDCMTVPELAVPASVSLLARSVLGWSMSMIRIEFRGKYTRVVLKLSPAVRRLARASSSPTVLFSWVVLGAGASCAAGAAAASSVRSEIVPDKHVARGRCVR